MPPDDPARPVRAGSSAAAPRVGTVRGVDEVARPDEDDHRPAGAELVPATGEDPEPLRVRLRAAAARARVRAGELDHSPAVVAALRRARRLVPGDPEFGDPLSMAGRDSAGTVARVADRLYDERQRASREAGLAALQVWQAAARRMGRRGTDAEVAILFTDLVGFSAWTLRAGDDAALQLLREVSVALENPVRAHRGQVVKRLGDGLMAIFPDPQLAVDALVEGRANLAAIHVAGHTPHVRAGLHLGRPRPLGGDYLGVDVNVAARLSQEARTDELLVSEGTLARLDLTRVEATRDRRFRWSQVKGVPEGMTAYTVVPRRRPAPPTGTSLR